jgi:hypothetical protein
MMPSAEPGGGWASPIVIEFRAAPGINPIIALRQLLKFDSRALGMRCTKIRVGEK